MAAKKAAKSEKTIVMTDVAEEKRKALEHALTELDKQFGKGSVMKLGADSIHRDIPVIPTGCLTLDAALGVGGIPRGRIVEIYGPESSGKTTVALHVVAEAQKAGGIAAFVDAEMPWIRNTRGSWASILRSCMFPSRIPASRLWKLPKPWFAPARWTWWLSTRWRRWFPRRKSTEIWGNPLWACRPGS